jgi:hypothetical protein
LSEVVLATKQGQSNAEVKEEAAKEREAVAARSQALQEKERELQQRADEVRRSVERGWKVAHVLSVLSSKEEC